MNTNETEQALPTGEQNPAPGLPDDMLIILPVRNMVMFPGVVLPVAIKREKTVAGAQEARAHRGEGRVPAAEGSADRGSRPRRPAPRRHRCQHHPLHHRAGRHAPPRLPGRAAFPRARPRERLPVPRGTRRVPGRYRDDAPRGRGPDPLPEAEGRRGDLAAAAGAGRAREQRAGDGVVVGAGRHGRRASSTSSPPTSSRSSRPWTCATGSSSSPVT